MQSSWLITGQLKIGKTPGDVPVIFNYAHCSLRPLDLPLWCLSWIFTQALDLYWHAFILHVWQVFLTQCSCKSYNHDSEIKLVLKLILKHLGLSVYFRQAPFTKANNESLPLNMWTLKNIEMMYQVVRYSRFWNCCAVYLVSKMPTPSIRASRTPPIMEEPTIAKGPPGESIYININNFWLISGYYWWKKSPDLKIFTHYTV